MIEVGHGIDVCYEGIDTYVIFADGRTKRYSVGGMLFEISDDEAFYMITEKVGKMIHCYPGFSDPLTEESFKDGFHWLYCAIDDEEFPVATALFQSTFFVTMNRVLEEIPAFDTCSCTGEFFLRCFKEYIDDMKAFAVFTDAVTQYDSGMADEFYKELAQAFKKQVDEIYVWHYNKKDTVRHKKNGGVTLEIDQINSFLLLLIFEYCRLKKTNKVIKQCANCGRIFIPLKRNDTKYCFMPSPQNPKRCCKDIAPQLARTEKRRNDPLERDHNRKMSKLGMAAKRARDSGEDASYFEKRIDEEIKEHQSKKDNQKSMEDI